MEASSGMVGLGIVSAADASLEAIHQTRFLPPSQRQRAVGAEFVVTGTVTSVKIRPVYIRNPDGGSGQVVADMDRVQDDSQEVTFTAAGAYYREFTARPGYWTTFFVQTYTVADGGVDIRAQYLPGSPR